MTVRARIGLPGQLIEIPGTSALAQSAERASSRRVTLGGRLVTQEAAREHRTWEVTLRQGSRPQDVANLAALAAGEWGRGPFVFASEWAQVTNLLTPEEASLTIAPPPDRVMVGGPVTLADGSIAGRHWVVLPGPEDLILPILLPVPAPMSTRPSLYTNGGCRIGFQPYNAADEPIGLYLGSRTLDRTSTVRREYFQFGAGAGGEGVYLRPVIRGSASTNFPEPVIIARPAATWHHHTPGTPDLLPWYPGQGVRSVIIEGLTTEVVAAWAGQGGQRAGYSFNVVEVN